jgi:hypothetical protein
MKNLLVMGWFFSLLRFFLILGTKIAKELPIRTKQREKVRGRMEKDK